MKHKILLFIALCTLVLSCTTPTPKDNKPDPFPIKYENDLFSINLPKGWEYDDSRWKGLDSVQNEVDFDSSTAPVWFHVVKTFMPIQWKNVDEAASMAQYIRLGSGDNVEFMDKIDSVEVSGYPTTILYFANYEGNDTIIQKQFVTYMEDSHIVIYFNENFYINQWYEAQEYGDKIIETIKLKKVTNPLEKEGVVKERLLKDAGNQ